MKGHIKKMIPNALLPLAQRVYRKLFRKLAKANFSQAQLDALTALKCTISYNKYGGYCVPESSRHRPAAQRILANDVWEPKTIEFMRANCGQGDIVHAGTYFGDFLPALSSAVASGSKIWAFEPNLENFRCAKITLDINGVDNVELINAGVGAKQESLRLKTEDHYGKSLGGASQIISDGEIDGPGSEAIQIVTVNGIVGQDRNVSIIQFDVEGYEKEALTGCLETIRRCHPILILEVWPDSSLIAGDWFSENILSLGYCKSTDLHGNTVFMCQQGA